MSGRKKSTQLERILQEIGIRGHAEPLLLKDLTILLQHPSQISESAFLREDDPLKIAAQYILDDFEALTNGMNRPGGSSPSVPDSDNPLYPWKLLTDAVASFYENKPGEMMKTVRRFPEGSAVSVLTEVFEILAGRGALTKQDGDFIETIRTRNRKLEEGLEILEEAASYPDLLRNEIAHYVREMSAESEEAGERLYYWAMAALAEDEPLSEKDEIPSCLPGAGEASRICALASMKYDPERALTAWLRSLHSVLEEGNLKPAELTARLSIAESLLSKSETENLCTGEILSSTVSYLNFSYPLMKTVLPSLPQPPADAGQIKSWLTGAAEHRPVKGRRRKRKKRQGDSPELFLFEEVS
jgi:hypothetical protein